ncbi:hypothetical protein COLU111180_14205 [Cohnella lubricantis]
MGELFILMKKKSVVAILAMMLSVALVLSGCSESKSPKDQLAAAIEKSADIKSYSLNGSMKIEDLQLPDEVMQEEGAAQALGLLTGAELSWTGAYQADPMLVELNMKISISGDLAMSFNLPMIMNEEKMWIKIPNIPMLGLPEELTSKFVEFNLKELAEQQGTEWPGAADMATTTKFANDLSGIFFKHIDEKTYLSEVKAKDVGISDDKDLKSIVQVHVMKDQVEPLVNTVLKNIAPEVIDLLAGNEEYRKLLELQPEDLDEAKKQLAEVKDEDVKEALAEFNEAVNTLDVTANLGINDKGYSSYTDATVKVGITEEGQSGSGTLKVVSEMTNINGDVKFEFGEPKAEDVISEEELNEQLGGMFGSMMME